MKVLPISNYNYRQQVKNVNFGQKNLTNKEMKETLTQEIKFNAEHIKELQTRINSMMATIESTTDTSSKEILKSRIKTLKANIEEITKDNEALINKIKSMNNTKKNVTPTTPYTNPIEETETKLHGWYGDYNSKEMDEYIRDIMNPPCSFL